MLISSISANPVRNPQSSPDSNVPQSNLAQVAATTNTPLSLSRPDQSANASGSSSILSANPALTPAWKKFFDADPPKRMHSSFFKSREDLISPPDITPALASFLKAARTGDVNTGSVLLECGLNVNGIDNNRKTALIWSAVEGEAGFMRMLLEHKDIHVNLNNPLLWVTKFGDIKDWQKISHFLFNAPGIDLNGESENGGRALNAALNRQEMERIDAFVNDSRTVLKHGAPSLVGFAKRSIFIVDQMLGDQKQFMPLFVPASAVEQWREQRESVSAAAKKQIALVEELVRVTDSDMNPALNRTEWIELIRAHTEIYNSLNVFRELIVIPSTPAEINIALARIDHNNS